MVRFKNRYLLIQLIYGPYENQARDQNLNVNLNEKILVDLVRQSMKLNFGDLGAGEAGADLNVKYYSPATSNVILRCKRDHVNKVRSSLFFINQATPQVPVIFNVIHVSGTIRKTQKVLIELDRQQILRFDQENQQDSLESKNHFDKIMNLEP